MTDDEKFAREWLGDLPVEIPLGPLTIAAIVKPDVDTAPDGFSQRTWQTMPDVDRLAIARFAGCLKVWGIPPMAVPDELAREMLAE
jgi:hypothetical protein